MGIENEEVKKEEAKAQNAQAGLKGKAAAYFGSMDFFKKMTFAMVALSALAVLFLMISVISSIAGRSKGESEKKDSGMVNVSVKEIKPEVFRDELTLNADLKSLNGVVSVPSPVAGTLVENIARRGDRVRKGDVLGIVDASDVGVRYKEAPVIAKADGTVTEVNFSVNQKVSAADVLYRIEPDPDFVLRASVSESDVDTIALGALGTFSTAGDKAGRHTARLTFISPSVNASNRTVDIELDVDDDAENVRGLRSGNYVSLRLVRNEYENVCVVPRDALRTYIDGQVVFVVDADNVAHRVPVKVGSSNEAYSVITDGLKSGDVVVVQGTPQEGDKVQIL